MTAPKLDPLRQAAADWLTRIQDPDATVDTWLDWQAWLEADPAHRSAYEEFEALWLDLEEPAAILQITAGATTSPVAPGLYASRPIVEVQQGSRPRRSRGPSWRRGANPIRWLIGGGAIAAGITALIILPLWQSPVVYDYVTEKGEVRAITLSDGSQLTLAGDTRLSVLMRPGSRKVSLARGQATFDVTHRPGRPFVVGLGDQTIRVIGTEFNVSRSEGRTAVTVRRGIVAVAQKGGGEVRLTKGQQVLHAEGSLVQQVRSADADAVFAWRSGRLVYANAPLATVVDDFNRYGAIPIRIDPSAADVKVTGVFFVDRQPAMVGLLAHFSGVTVITHPNEIVLKSQ